jgi:hypothetical protein
LVHETHVAPLLREDRQYRGHVAADRVARDSEAIRIESLFRALRDDPARRRLRLLDRDGMAGLRRTVVLDESDRGLGAHGELANEPIMGAGIAEDPASSVHIKHHGHEGLRLHRLDDPDAHVTDLGAGGDPFVGTSGFSTGAAWMSSSTLRAPPGPSS